MLFRIRIHANVCLRACMSGWGYFSVSVRISVIEIVCLRVFMRLLVRVWATARGYVPKCVVACVFVILMCNCVCK